MTDNRPISAILQAARRQKSDHGRLEVVEYEFEIPLASHTAAQCVIRAAEKGWLPRSMVHRWNDQLEILSISFWKEKEGGKGVSASTSAETAEVQKQGVSSQVVALNESINNGVNESPLSGVERVVKAYELAFPGKRTTLQMRLAVQLRLEEGYTVEQLVQAVEHVRNTPGCIPSRELPNLRSILRNEDRLRKWLGLPKRAGAPSWQTPYYEEFRRRYPLALFEHGEFSRFVWPLHEKLGLDTCFAEWKRFLDYTRPQGISGRQFAKAIGTVVRHRGDSARRNGDMIPSDTSTGAKLGK